MRSCLFSGKGLSGSLLAELMTLWKDGILTGELIGTPPCTVLNFKLVVSRPSALSLFNLRLQQLHILLLHQ